MNFIDLCYCYSLAHLCAPKNVAIAISTDVVDKIDGVGQVGGVVGAPSCHHVILHSDGNRKFAGTGVGSSVSASFLFIVGLANSIILHRVLRKRRQVRTTSRDDSLPNGD
jgi:high-affinity nickel-transport protein